MRLTGILPVHGPERQGRDALRLMGETPMPRYVRWAYWLYLAAAASRAKMSSPLSGCTRAAGRAAAAICGSLSISAMHLGLVVAGDQEHARTGRR